VEGALIEQKGSRLRVVLAGTRSADGCCEHMSVPVLPACLAQAVVHPYGAGAVRAYGAAFRMTVLTAWGTDGTLAGPEGPVEDGPDGFAAAAVHLPRLVE
jgi:hypothetical protein